MGSSINLSYHRRLYALVLAFIWLIVGFFALFQYVRERQFKSENLNAQLQLCNIHILEEFNDGVEFCDYNFPSGFPFKDIRLTVIDPEGTVLYDSRHPAESLDNHISRPEVQSAMRSGEGFHISRKSASDGKQYFYSATYGEGLIIRTAIPYSASLKDILRADRTFFWILICASLLISIAGYFATRGVGRTIERINAYREQEASMREEQEKNRLKRQLTNNINHELKTPVASIQVCLETLLSGISLTEEKRLELIERCYSHNERLRHLLEDVSLITRMEDGSGRIEREAVVINELLDDIASELSIMPEGERFELKMDFKEQVIINGNQSLIGSIFRNLTENAISYSEGKTIYITLADNNEKYCRIIFEDDGQGVDEKNLPRLFERFYRVDKGRSRSKGGTGLGLSIVKHAVQFHGGTISASNRKEGGLRFDFTLLKNQLI